MSPNNTIQNFVFFLTKYRSLSLSLSLSLSHTHTHILILSFNFFYFQVFSFQVLGVSDSGMGVFMDSLKDFFMALMDASTNRAKAKPDSMAEKSRAP